MKRKIAILFMAGLLSFTLILFVKPNQSYSENENRFLTDSVNMSLENILTGKFQSQLADYLTDQFPFREKILALRTTVEKLIGKKEINNVWIGEKGYYFEKVTDEDINYDNYIRNLNRIEKMGSKFEDSHFTLMLVPSSAIVYSNLLEQGTPVYDSNRMYELTGTMEHVNVIDLRSVLNGETENLFYHTDHHWTMFGAQKAYCFWKQGNEQPLDIVSDCFYGTLYSRVLDQDAQPDCIYTLPVDEEIEVIADGLPGKLYDTEKLAVKDKYQYYLSGNHGRVDIYGKGEGAVLILKDSFANCFVPFLLNEYEHIVMIDLRYYPNAVSNIFNEMKIDDVLVLYQMTQFANDTNLAKLSLSISE